VRNACLARLEAALADTADVYVNDGIDAAAWFRQLADDIRAHVCQPFEVTAIIEPPGFPDAAVGSMISGSSVARNPAGLWLVYQPAQDRFYGCWGARATRLGAHGVCGSPLYCWSA